MKLIVFGATGSVGRHIVSQALEKGHDVTAFARHPEKLALSHPRLHRQAGNVLDPEAVSAAVADHDAVLIALGAGRRGGVRAQGTRNILAAMVRHGVRRLVCQTTLGTGDSRPLLNFFWKRIMFGLLLRPAYLDHEEQEAAIRASDRDWTIVRPSAFTDDVAGGPYRHGFGAGETGLNLTIPRGDVAGFMLKQLGDDTYLRASPALSY